MKNKVLTKWMPVGDFYTDRELFKYEKGRTPYHYANSVAAIIKMQNKYIGIINKSGKVESERIVDDDIISLKSKIDLKLFNMGYSLDNLFQ